MYDRKKWYKLHSTIRIQEAIQLLPLLYLYTLMFVLEHVYCIPSNKYPNVFSLSGAAEPVSVQGWHLQEAEVQNIFKNYDQQLQINGRYLSLYKFRHDQLLCICMASYKKISISRRHHTYKSIRMPVILRNDIYLVHLEDNNAQDRHTHVMIKDDCIVGCLPRCQRNIPCPRPQTWCLLRQGIYKRKAFVEGNMVISTKLPYHS